MSVYLGDTEVGVSIIPPLSYGVLPDKPQINGVELVGNKTTEELGIVSVESDPTVPQHVKNITTNDISNWNNKSDFSGYYRDLLDTPTQVSVFENDAGYLTKIPEDYITETKLAAKNYVTETKLVAKNYITGTDLLTYNFVTDSSLLEKNYATVVYVDDSVKTKADVTYVDKKVADLIGTVPETLDTLEEIAKAIQDNKDVVDTLNEAIGSKADKTELSDYVKNTDYATNTTAGIVKVVSGMGIEIDEGNHYLTTSPANKSDIDAKTNYRKPIVPVWLDYAVKVGLTTNTETLTDEEKTAAKTWLGVEDKTIANLRLKYSNSSATITTDGKISYETVSQTYQDYNGTENVTSNMIVQAKQLNNVVTAHNNLVDRVATLEDAPSGVSQEDFDKLVNNETQLSSNSDNSIVIGGASLGTSVGTPTDAVAIGKTAKSTINSVAIGSKASMNLGNNVCIGYNSYSFTNGVSIGSNARGTAGSAITIGGNATTNGLNAIQLGSGTNNTDNTLQIKDDNIYNHKTHTLTVQNIELNGEDIKTLIPQIELTLKDNGAYTLTINKG